MKTILKFSQIILLTCMLLVSLAVLSKLRAQSYYNPAHYHIDYVVINKNIDSYMPIVVSGISAGYFFLHGKYSPKSERDALAAIGLFTGIGYAILMETEWFTNVKKSVRHKIKHRR